MYMSFKRNKDNTACDSLLCHNLQAVSSGDSFLPSLLSIAYFDTVAHVGKINLDPYPALLAIV